MPTGDEPSAFLVPGSKLSLSQTGDCKVLGEHAAYGWSIDSAIV